MAWYEFQTKAHETPVKIFIYSSPTRAVIKFSATGIFYLYFCEVSDVFTECLQSRV